MEGDDIRAGVVSVLTAVAPEVDPAELDDHQPLRDQVDLDSMDWLNFLRRLHRRYGVDIPESDYAALQTMADIVAYLGRARSSVM
ncbi:phosphopantetheine-binding protein [Mycobacterium sp. djl-10]|jgi:acyl carrier protein|nr:phosphopantetheine-binding protein [Mycobacterium sp. djl-10]